MKSRDITGQKFNMLTAISYAESRGGKQHWAFKCDCGNNLVARKSHVTSLWQKSCGCLHIVARKMNKISQNCRDANIKAVTSHGMTRTRFYELWHTMKARCLNPNTINYYKYGGRGIEVCDRWQKFENFKDDMYEPYLRHTEEFGERQTTLDRKNSDGNYEPKNCRWATYKEQNINRKFKKPQCNQETE